MYSTNLTKISLDEFQNILTTIDLLPSRKILLNGLSDLVESLKQKGIENLAATAKIAEKQERIPPTC